MSRSASIDHGDLMKTTPAAMNEPKDEGCKVLQLEVNERPCMRMSKNVFIFKYIHFKGKCI